MKFNLYTAFSSVWGGEYEDVIEALKVKTKGLNDEQLQSRFDVFMLEICQENDWQLMREGDNYIVYGQDVAPQEAKKALNN